MKKIIALIALMMPAVSMFAQVSSLSENFSSCPVGDHSPTGWSHFNAIPGTAVEGAWTCGATNGKGGTPGIECTGYYGSAYNLDTAYFVSPLVNFSSYPDSIFLRFDTKTENIILGGKLALIITHVDSMFDSSSSNMVVNRTSSVTPLFGNGDQTDWVTHEADMTPFKGAPFYIAFRFTSSTTSGVKWFLDNINTATLPLRITNHSRETYSMSVSGNYARPGSIALSYTVPEPGKYDLAMYDMTGRQVLQQTIVADNEAATENISAPELPAGIYVIKMGNGRAQGIAKMPVRQ